MYNILVCNMHVNAVLLIKYGQKYFKFMHQFFLIINFNHFDSLKLNFLEWGDWQGYGLDLLMTEILNFLMCLVLPEWRDSGWKRLGISFSFILLSINWNSMMYSTFLCLIMLYNYNWCKLLQLLRLYEFLTRPPFKMALYGTQVMWCFAKSLLPVFKA